MKHIFDEPQFGENWFNYDEVYRRLVQNCKPDGKIFKERNP